MWNDNSTLIMQDMCYNLRMTDVMQWCYVLQFLVYLIDLSLCPKGFTFDLLKSRTSKSSNVNHVLCQFWISHSGYISTLLQFLAFLHTHQLNMVDYIVMLINSKKISACCFRRWLTPAKTTRFSFVQVSFLYHLNFFFLFKD